MRIGQNHNQCSGGASEVTVAYGFGLGPAEAAPHASGALQFEVEESKERYAKPAAGDGEVKLVPVTSAQNPGDADDVPSRRLFRGQPTGSVCPLLWAHGEYVKLRRSIRDRRVFDAPRQTFKRYLA